MQVIIHGQNMEVTPAIREYIEKKIGRLSRYFDNIADIQVHASTQRSFKTAEVTVNANGHLIRAQERTSDLHTSIDQVVDKLEAQLRHYKERMVDRNRRPQRHGLLHADERHRAGAEPGAADANAEAAMGSEEAAAPPPQIMRRKKYVLERMNAVEAADHMQLLGHSFYMFLNEESSQINVVYAREEGGFGVLEPEV